MVRHHVSKSKKKSSQKRDEEKRAMEKRLKDLNRFAGSSEDDGNDNDDNDGDVIDDMSEEDNGDADRHISVVDKKGTRADGRESEDEDEYHISTIREKNTRIGSNNYDSGEDEHADDESSSSDEDEYHGGTTMNHNYDSDGNDGENSRDDGETNDGGYKAPASQMKMAFAMSKILGLSSNDTTTSISKTISTTQNKKTPILSKTITPLQKMQKKEEQKIQELKLKRKQRRENNLIALHKPLSTATSTFHPNNSDKGASFLAKEIEMESMHRRVATRGVVALFNTIAKHQQQQQQEQTKDYGNDSTANNGKEQQVKSMTKFGFLDMLKQTASEKNPQDGRSDNISGNVNNEKESRSKKNTSISSSSGWNALKDDFMMNSKLKDWDKEISDDDDDEIDSDSIVDDDDDDDDDSIADEGKGRKRIHEDDLDNIMDDDGSSSDDEAMKRTSSAKRRKKIS